MVVGAVPAVWIFVFYGEATDKDSVQRQPVDDLALGVEMMKWASYTAAWVAPILLLIGFLVMDAVN